MAAGNKLLGEFNLEGIPPSPRGLPQIEVTFDIDANGILHVGAKDKASGKENKITIKANSGLTEAEIQNMVQDAASHAEEDRRAKELADARNTGDALVHATRKTLTEQGAQVEPAERQSIEDAVARLEEALKGSDKAGIDARIAEVSSAAQKLAEKMASQQQAGAAGAGAGAAGAGQGGGQAQPQEDVVDADFREVKGS
jgi:molecular chaperone DnaK